MLKFLLTNGREHLLTSGNRELAEDGIYTWTLPALAAKLSTGKNFLTCPNAGACSNLCYARAGTYNFSNVKKAHTDNLELILGGMDSWRALIIAELRKSQYKPTGRPARYMKDLDSTKMPEYVQQWAKYGGKTVRIHDSGDFFSQDYFVAWLTIAKATPWVFFYAYTKEVTMTKEHKLPENFILIYSMGGKQDHLIDMENDRHAEVFPSMEALREAGYTDQEHSDIFAAILPTNKIGIVVNNIKHLKKRQGNETFGSIQRARDESK